MLKTLCFAIAALACSISRADAASSARLPDGTDFVFWETPQAFTKTYYVDGSSPRSNDNGPGTLKRPFRTINKAADILRPGERVVISAGVYREFVRPARGGSGPDKMISYEASPGAVVIIRASEVLRDWQPSAEGIWKHELSGALFPDAYNPFAMSNIPGDWSWLDTKRVDMGPYIRRRGMIFVDGKPLEPVEQFRELEGDQPPRRLTGLPARSRGAPIMQEIGGSPDGRFWVEHQGNVLHIRLPSGSPDNSMVEVTTREQAFAPRESGLGYIRMKGLTFQHAGNAFPPPQRGLVSTGGGHHWIIEGNTIEWASGVGLDIGSQHWSGARNPQAGDSHIVRGNTFRYIGVEGIGGMGTSNTLVEDNLIEWIGWQDAERAWEAAGAKFHRARNLLFRRNVVRHIRHANAVWLDVGNSNSRITGNVLADVLTVSAAIHMEMSLEPNQIDNNIIWDVRNSEPGTPGQRGAAGSGIFLHASQNQIVAQNLIGRCDNVGVFPALRPDRAGSGNARGHKIHDNVFAACDKGGIVFLHEDNEADGNVYASLPEKFLGLAESDTIQWLDLPTWQAHGWDKNGKVARLELSFDPDRLELSASGDTALAQVPLADMGSLKVRSVDPRVGPETHCAALTKFTLPEHRVVIRQAQEKAGVCRVDGVIDERTGRDGKPYGIGFAVSLPANWNGRFLFQGGGGLNGSVQPPVGGAYAGERSALARGFAVASTDSGHQSTGFDGSFFRDQQASLNFLYQAVAEVTVVAKAIVRAHYGKVQQHAYFVGCSTGGREAMMMSQRFPDYFDGIVAAAPAARTSFSNLGLRHATAALNAAPLSEADRKLLIDGVLEACDALDGNKDGLIFAPQNCKFDPGTLALSAAQVNAIRSVMQGPRTTAGRQVYPGYFYDTGIATTQGLPGVLAGPVIPEGPPVGKTFDVDAAAADAMDARAMVGDSSAWTNLSTFRGHGGKLIFLHGVSDPWFSAKETVRYYELLGRDNTEAPLADWSRLFLVPGMGHCGGGARTLDQFDMLTAVVDWVEAGRAPDRVISTGASAPGESRPLCPYPAHAHYAGSGDAREAANYTCQE